MNINYKKTKFNRNYFSIYFEILYSNDEQFKYAIDL